MSILRSGGSPSAKKKLTFGSDKGITVRCPKCQSRIVFTTLQNDAPIRCGKCNYPMVCRSDLFLLVEACKKIDSSAQAKCAVDVLRRLSEVMPEAGTALGMLPTLVSFPLAVKDAERWNMLENAYAAGDDNAREGLELMIKASPGIYSARYCSSCGAKKYFEKHGRSSCPYCHSTD